MHNLRRCFCPRFSQKTLQLKGYFKVTRAIFRLSLRPKIFTHQTFAAPPHLRSRSSRRSAPTPQCRSFVIRPCTKRDSPIVSPLKRVEFALKLQEKIHATNAAEHRENFAARKIQSRPAVRLDDTTECTLLKKCTSFKTQKRRQPRRRTRRHALRSSNTDAFKMPLKRLADAFASIQISLKAQKIANPRPCTGVRDKDGRAYAPIRINIIYMMSNVRLG